MSEKMNKIFGYLNTLPWTKPIAIIVFAVGLFVFVGASFVGLLWGCDLPPNTADFGKWLVTSVIGISGAKSAYESVRGDFKGRGGSDENDNG